MEARSDRMTSAVALMAVFSLGISFILIGAVSEELKKSLGISNAEIGSLVSALFLTSVIVQLVIGPLVDRFGHKPLAIAGFLLAAAGMMLIASASIFGTAFAACVLLGIGAMCLNTVGNTLIPVVLFGGRDPARASNFGNAFFGLGYVITPLLFPLFAALSLSYKTGIFILAALLLVFLAASLGAAFPGISTGYRFSMAFKLLGDGAVLIAALALFCYISLEISMATWSKPYMTELFGGSQNERAVANAGLILSIFGVAMMVGRFITSTVRNLTAMGIKVIAAMALAAALAVLVMIFTRSAAIAIAAVILTGLVFAPIFPTIVGVTFARFEPRLYGSIFGIVFAVGLLGATLVPPVIGRMSEGATVQESLRVVVAMALVLFVVSLLMGRIGRRTRNG